MNARSLVNNFKIEELQCYVTEHELDILAVCETWFNDNVSDTEISIDNFTVFRKNREAIKEGRGGGVVLYVRDTLNAFSCDNLYLLKNESV